MPDAYYSTKRAEVQIKIRERAETILGEKSPKLVAHINLCEAMPFLRAKLVTLNQSRRNTATFREDEYSTEKRGGASHGTHAQMGSRRDGLDTPPAALFAAQATASEPTYAVARSGRAQRYAGLLAAVICDGNPTAKREYEHMLAQERQRAKSFGTNQV